jgi:hypothetical protein
VCIVFYKAVFEHWCAYRWHGNPRGSGAWTRRKAL